jgi:hypothetical protein
MLKIGEFSRLAQVPVATLRYSCHLPWTVLAAIADTNSANMPRLQ